MPTASTAGTRTAMLPGECPGIDTARTITAWATGFLGMEFCGAFQLGGDVDETFEFGAAWLPFTRGCGLLTLAIPVSER